MLSLLSISIAADIFMDDSAQGQLDDSIHCVAFIPWAEACMRLQALSILYWTSCSTAKKSLEDRLFRVT